MEYIDFKILEIGLPQSLIERGGNPISELISTVDLFNEMIEIYNGLYDKVWEIDHNR